MNPPAHTTPTEDQLVGALDALDVPFLMGGVQDEIARTLRPAELFVGLARSKVARVRSAIIPLLLRHPEFANDAQLASIELEGQPRATLQLFYTAAMLLQKKYAARLNNLFGTQPQLPDFFSKELDLELPEDVELSLERLGERNTQMLELKMNWVGGYHQAALTWLKYIELMAERSRKRTWQTV